MRCQHYEFLVDAVANKVDEIINLLAYIDRHGGLDAKHGPPKQRTTLDSAFAQAHKVAPRQLSPSLP